MSWQIIRKMRLNKTKAWYFKGIKNFYSLQQNVCFDFWQWKDDSSRHGGKTLISDVDKQLPNDKSIREWFGHKDWEMRFQGLWTHCVVQKYSLFYIVRCNSGKLIYSKTVLLERTWTQLEYFHFIVLLPCNISERNSCSDRWFCTKHIKIIITVMWRRAHRHLALPTWYHRTLD